MGVELAGVVRRDAVSPGLIEPLRRLDYLIANASAMVATALLETRVKGYDLQLETDTRGAFFIAQADEDRWSRRARVVG